MRNEPAHSPHRALTLGDTIPSFEAYDEEGILISSEEIKGTTTVIYFYPKDGTSDCTKQACQIRDSMDALDEKGVIIMGISPDGQTSHKEFIHNNKLNFGLLTDIDLHIAKKFGAVKRLENGSYIIERSTYLIDKEGIIRWIEKPVTVIGHIARVLKAVEDIQ